MLTNAKIIYDLRYESRGQCCFVRIFDVFYQFRHRELERQQARNRYNDWLNNDFGKGSLDGFGMVPMYKEGGPDWTEIQFRIGFFL